MVREVVLLVFITEFVVRFVVTKPFRQKEKHCYSVTYGKATFCHIVIAVTSYAVVVVDDHIATEVLLDFWLLNN